MSSVRRRPTVAALATAIALSSCMLVPAFASEGAQATDGVAQAVAYEATLGEPAADEGVWADAALSGEDGASVAGEGASDEGASGAGDEGAVDAGDAGSAGATGDAGAGESTAKGSGADAGEGSSSDAADSSQRGDEGASSDADAGDASEGAAAGDKADGSSSESDGAASSEGDASKDAADGEVGPAGSTSADGKTDASASEKGDAAASARPEASEKKDAAGGSAAVDSAAKDGEANALDADAKAKKAGWVTEDGQKVYYDKDGKKLTGKQTIEGKTYYFDAKGVMQTGQQKIGNSWYYFDSADGGAMASDRFVYLDKAANKLDTPSKTVYYNADGTMRYGQLGKGGAWYFLDFSSGARAESSFAYLDKTLNKLDTASKTCYYDADGHMHYGQLGLDGSWYFLDFSSGARAENSFVYLDKAANKLDTNSKTCYYGTNGAMRYGEQEVGGSWYYLNPSSGGRAESSWVTLTGAYLDGGAKTVYYDASGKMLHGTHIIDGYRRWFDPSTGATDKAGYQNPYGYYQVSSNNVWVANYSGNAAFSYASPSQIGVWANRWDCVNAFVGRAYDYIGTSYVWDYALAPGNGIDCAGLVMQCLYATGMDLGSYTPYNHYYVSGHDHYANDMAYDSGFASANLSDRQVGDLILYEGHVGIYIGNDQMIDAWPSGGVQVRSIWHYGSAIRSWVKRPFA